MVLMSEGALMCKAVPTKASPALQNHLGMECTLLLCLFKLLMCARGSDPKSLILGEELIIPRCLERNKQAKKKKMLRTAVTSAQMTDQSRQAPQKTPHAEIEMFL